MNQNCIKLDWPYKGLSPNESIHWAKKAKVKARYRRDCNLNAFHQGLRKIEADRVDVNIIFAPPDNRKRDDDNMIGSFKAGRDGVADLIGIDDNKWNVSYAFIPPVKGGAVHMTITPSEGV